MRHEMLTQRARFCIGVMAKKGTLSQHFVTHVVPPLVQWIYAAFEFQVLPWMIPWAGWCKLASRSLHSQGVLG